jgi:hypothetical protein
MNRILRVWIGSWCLAVLALFLWFVVLPMVAHGATLTHATYTDPAGARWCVTLGYTGQGADGRPWAWVTIDADSRRLVHVPLRDLRDLRDRCAQPVAVDRSGVVTNATVK